MDKKVEKLFNDNILKQAASAFEVKAEDLESVGGFENLIYSYMKDGSKYILRISHNSRNDLNLILAELEFMDYLSMNGANVVSPILNKHNELAIQLDDGFIATGFEFAEGRHAGKDDYTEEFLREYGRNIATMHKLSKTYEPKHKRYDFRDDHLIKNARSYLPATEMDIADKMDEVLDEVYKLPINTDSFGLIHTDVHAGNFFINDGKFMIFDFDDSSYKHFISDIAIVVFYPLFLNPGNVERASFIMKFFMEGYNEINRIDSVFFENFNLFLKVREILIYLVIFRNISEEERKEGWPKAYLEMFRDRIINDVPYVDIDFTQFNG
jgi:Ser/Thr protein kinase RdoA (MazF antagonist)